MQFFGSVLRKCNSLQYLQMGETVKKLKFYLDRIHCDNNYVEENLSVTVDRKNEQNLLLMDSAR